MSENTVRRPPLGLLCTAQFMLVLDFAIVNVALPSMQRDLGFTDAALQWVVGAYALFYGGFLLLGGRLGDLVGRKRMFVGGLAVFTAASLVGGFATEPIVLVLSRALQGLSAAAVSPAVLALIAGGFTEPKARAKAMGIFGAVASAGFTGGVLFGGILTEYLGWRSVMWVNVPVGILLVLAAIKALNADHAQARGGRVDVPGAILVTGGMSAIIYALTVAAETGWGAPGVLWPLIGGGVALIAFLVLQSRLSAPLVPLSIFANRGVTTGNAIAFLSGGVMSISTFFMSVYMQQVLGFSAIQTGLAFFPQALIVVLASKNVAMTTGSKGARPVLLGGAVVLTAGSLLLTGIPVDGSFWADILPGGLLLGLGVTVMMISTAVAGTHGVPIQRMGLASGLYNSSRQLGVGLWLAVGVTASGLAGNVGIQAYHTAFWLSAGLSVLIAVLAVFVPTTRAAAPAAPAREAVASK
ncbi:MFS transporter [Nonomuraea sp. NN258]|uniref:MFS transporter n=1 Tax=Nonomuraea antri TaxID=2730852 RepID=UPI001567F223|nr:MFS transporter [Nonomuraea antri]NRQ34228.1 MFS transporter [Nonomuraea antri]